MAGLFSSSTLEQVRAASDIVEVIGAALPLKRSGAGFVALCPFHKEKTPSFTVNPHRQIFHCFGCHKGGDVFRFVQEYEGISFPEAVRRLAERAHIPLETLADPGAQQRHYLKETLLQLHEAIAHRWQAVLTHDAAGQPARDYLQQRRISETALRLFRLGAAPESWDDTVNWARAKGYDLQIVEQAGLILRKEGSDRYYDRFRGRLIFPIADEQGRVIGFSGRVLSGDAKTAKYVNSPETPIFTKGRVCYGLDKAKRDMLDAGTAVVCEGQLDLIACHSAGVRNVVAPQGTALTAEHARILRRYVQEVILCFDSDPAGHHATIRSLDDLLASGLAIRVAEVPPPHDPDSYILEHGPEAFRQLIQKARGFFEYYLDRLTQEHNAASDRGRLAIVRLMGEALAKTGSAVLIDTHAQRTAQRLGVTPDAVRTEFRRAANRRPTPSQEAADSVADNGLSDHAADTPARPGNAEFWLLKLLLLDPCLLDWTERELDPAWIQHPGVSRVVQALLAARTATGLEVAAVVGSLENEHDRSLASEALAETREVPNRARQIADVLRRLRDQRADRELAALSRDLARTDLSDTGRGDLIRRQQAIRELKRRPIDPPAATL
jgi:DNA primase